MQISGITGVDLDMTARCAALLLWILNFAAGALICWLYDRGRGLRQGAVFVLVISLIHGGGELLVAQYNSSIAAFIPATVAMAAILPLSRLPMYRRAYACETSPMMARQAAAAGTEKPRGALWLYFSPYVLLILVTVVLLVVPPVHQALSRWSVGFAFPETRTAYGVVNAATPQYSPFHPLVDSGTVLLFTCIISYALLRSRGLLERSQLRAMLSRTLQKTRPVAVSLILLLIISKLIPLTLAIGAVVSGGLFGDHCSPISDTTIQSSTSACCDHLQHVKTQLPYALTVGISSLIGFLFAGLVAPALALPVTLVCIVAALLVMRNISRKQAAADA